jgi:tetratricopeptide (TPR) repeat protein
MGGVRFEPDWGDVRFGPPDEERSMKPGFLWLLVVAASIVPGRVRAQSNSAEANLHSANLLKRLGDLSASKNDTSNANEMYGKAVDSFKKAIALDPSGTDAYWGLGDLYMNTLRKYELALPVWVKLHELRPSDPHVLLVRGLAYKGLKRYDEALADFQAVLDMKADRESQAYAHQDIGLICLAVDEYAAAVPEFQSAIQLDPSNDQARNQLGMAHYGLKQYPEAAAAYKEAIRLKPDHAAYQANLGQTYAAMGRRDEALGVYRDVVKLDKAQGKWLRERLEEWSISVADAPGEGLGELEKSAVKTYLTRGDGHLQANELPQAIDFYKRAVKLDPECGRAHGALAVCYYKQGQFEVAIAEWERALPWITASPNTYVLLGNSHVAMGKYDKALEAYREAADLKPAGKELALVEYSIGRAYREMKKYDLGIQHLRESLRVNPDSANANFVIGECYFFTDRYGEAAAALENVVRMRPKDTQGRVLLGYAYVSLKRFEAARAQCEVIKGLDADKAEMLGREIELKSGGR